MRYDISNGLTTEQLYVKITEELDDETMSVIHGHALKSNIKALPQCQKIIAEYVLTNNLVIKDYSVTLNVAQKLILDKKNEKITI